MPPPSSLPDNCSPLNNATIEKRDKEITGNPPRLTPLHPSDIGPEALALVSSVRKAAGLPQSTKVPEFVSTLLHHSELYAKHAAIGPALLGEGSLSARHRELAILRTAWLCLAPFEWGAHVPMAKRAGISTEEIECITKGSCSTIWGEQERAILHATEELNKNAMILDCTWEQLACFLDDRQLIEFIYVIGHYTKVAFLQNALRVRLPPGNEGLAAR